MNRSPLPTCPSVRPLALLAAFGLGAGAVLAGDITVTPTAGGAFAVKNAGNSADRLRVNEDGSVLIPAAASGAQQETPMCSGPGGIVGPCAPNAGGDGSYSAGTGLSLSGTTLSVAPPYRLPQACAAGTVLQATGPGAWACVALPGGGGGGSYSAGTGLSLSGTTLSVAPPYQLPQACVAGTVLQSTGPGTWACAALPGGGGATLPPGTVNQTLRYNASNAPQATSQWQVFGDGSLLATDAATNAQWLAADKPQGSYSSPPPTGSMPASGAGARMVWQPQKAAFRAGHVRDDEWDDNNVGYFSVAMGTNTRAIGGMSFAMGGDSTAQGLASIALGRSTTASGHYSIAMGQGSHAVGENSITMGAGSRAEGVRSIAMGYGAKASHANSFVWSGALSDIDAAESPADNTFTVYAQGGIHLYAGAPGSGGCHLSNPGSAGWSCSSDRKLKTAITPADTRAVLDKLLAMPVSHWAFKTAPQYRHIGPMAQDFKAAFDLGAEDDKHIASMDAQGVALAAIQGLNAKLEERSAQLAEQLAEKDRQLADLRATLAAQQARLGELQALATQMDRLQTQVRALQAAQPAPLLTAARP